MYLTDTQVEQSCDTLRKAINAAENSNHDGEVFVVAAANATALVEALEAWSAAEKATEESIEHFEQAVAEGWADEPGLSGHVRDSERRADAAWEKAGALRDAALTLAKGGRV